jgi:hypothetical protein
MKYIWSHQSNERHEHKQETQMSTTMTTLSYTIAHRPGYSATDHFGREIASRVTGQYPTLADARNALNLAKADHVHGGHNPGRFDIIASNGKTFAWE